MPNNVRIHTQVDGNAGKELKTLQDGWSTFQKKGAEGLAIGVGVTAAAKGFGLLDSAISVGIGFMSDSITKASDLNETMSKSEVIFGKNAKAVEDWASKMDTAAGLSEKAALDAASGFAGLFKTVGLGLDQSTEMSQKLTQMGADLASFFNTDIDEALAALKSGLNGESEPLRRFNIFLSETAVTAKLTAMGVQKVGGNFTEAQKATARYQLILDQTSDAQGDFARTSDGLANSQRVIAAEVDNLQASIGQDLLPVVRDLSNWAKNDGVPALKELFASIKDAGPAFAMLGQGVSDLERDLNGLDHNIVGAGIGIHNFFADLLGMGNTTKEAAAALNSAAGETRDLGYEVDNAADSIGHVDSVAKKAAPHITGLGGAAQKAADDFKELRKDATKAGQAIAEAAYGPEHLRLEFEKNRAELQDNQAELDKTGAKIKELGVKGKPVPKELRDKFRDLKIGVNESKQAVIEDGIKLHALGKISMSQLEAAFRRQGIRLDDLSGAAREYWIWLHRVQQIGGTINGSGGNGGRGSSNNDRGKAAGGNIAPNTWSTVGEKGMELAHARPGGGVDIFPLSGSATAGYGGFVGAARDGGGSSGGGGGSLTVNVYGVSVLTSGAANALAQQIAPVVTKWQQDRRLLGAR